MYTKSIFHWLFSDPCRGPWSCSSLEFCRGGSAHSGGDIVELSPSSVTRASSLGGWTSTRRASHPHRSGRRPRWRPALVLYGWWVIFGFNYLKYICSPCPASKKNYIFWTLKYILCQGADYTAQHQFKSLNLINAFIIATKCLSFVLSWQAA